MRPVYPFLDLGLTWIEAIQRVQRVQVAVHLGQRVLERAFVVLGLLPCPATRMTCLLSFLMCTVVTYCVLEVQDAALQAQLAWALVYVLFRIQRQTVLIRIFLH